jgi:hypothetical protein
MKGVNDFISYFDTGARPNFYDIVITSNPNLGEFVFATGASDGHNLRCISAAFPGVEIGVNEEATFGAPRQVPDGTVSYDGGLALTFLCDTTFYDRILIDAWQRHIFEAKPTASSYKRTGGTKFQPVMRYMDEYCGSIILQQLSQGGKPRMQYDFKDVWPISYSEQAVASSNEAGGIMEFEVTFEYKDFSVSYPNEPDEPRVIEPKDNGAKQDPLGKGSILDATLDTLNVLSRFNPKAGEYLNKLSGLEGQLTRGKNIKRKIGGLNIGGGGD